MNIPDILQRIEDTSVAVAMRGEDGWEWLFPNIETLHVIALATVFGSILMVDLRLLGLTSRSTAVSRLSSELLPCTWAAFSVAVITGTLMFMAKAHVYFYNLQFRLKMLCVLLAGANMIVFHLGAFRSVLQWDAVFPAPLRARLAGACSIVLWLGVVFFGRWIGFKT